MYCDYRCKNRHHAAARALRYAELKAHIRHVSHNMNVLGGLLGKKSLLAITDRQYLQNKNYNFDQVTAVRIEGESIQLMVDSFALEFLPGEKIRVSRTRKAMLDRRDKERLYPEYDFGVYYRKWKVEMPKEHNCLDVDWLVKMLREERKKGGKHRPNPPSSEKSD